MNVFIYAYRSGIRSILRNPTGTTGAVLFGLGFSLIAGNAMYSQPQVHPDPFWDTTDRVVTRSLEPTNVAEIPKSKAPRQPKSITRSVLTQRISLANIPVPTLKPTLRQPGTTQAQLVRETQEALAVMGLYKGKIDGISGSATSAAIIDYQKSANMLPDGSISYELLSRIQASGAATERIVEERKNQPPAPPVQQVSLPLSVAGVKLSQPKPSSFDREMVVRIQSGLKERFGEENIDVDGVFGNQTRNALKRFQAFFDLDPTGEIDARTLEKLLSAGVIQAI